MAFLSISTAAIVALVILGAVTVFHLLVIAGLVPTTMVWGGQFSDPAQVVRMETVSVAILIVAAAVFVLRWRSIATGEPSLVWAVAIWVFVGLFVLNTVGNLFAKTFFERVAMTPLTLALALLGLRLALGEGGVL